MMIPQTAQIKLLSNFFPIQSSKVVHKYKVELASGLPLTPTDHIEALKICTKLPQNREKLASNLGEHYQFLNGAIYSGTLCPAVIDLTLPPSPCDFDKFNITSIKILKDLTLELKGEDPFGVQLMGRIFKVLLKKLRLKQIGRKMFNPEGAQTVESFQIWPGFMTVLQINKGLFSLNIDIASKIITSNTARAEMDRVRNDCRTNFEEALTRALVGKSVMTDYNNMFYVVDGIDFNLNAFSSFTTKDNASITYVDYYQQKKGLTLKYPHHPLLISKDKKTKNVVHLMPEFCLITGLSDELRKDIGLMRKLDTYTKLAGNDRMGRTVSLLDELGRNQGTSSYLKSWNLSIDKNPMEVNALAINPGSLLFENHQPVNLTTTANLDRDIQKPFFHKVNFTRLVIFFPQQHQGEYSMLAENIQKVLEMYKWGMGDLRKVCIPNWNMNLLKEAIQNNLDHTCNGCLFLLPGPKKNGFLYK